VSYGGQVEGEVAQNHPGFGFKAEVEEDEQCWWFGGVKRSTPWFYNLGCGLGLCLGQKDGLGLVCVCVGLIIRVRMVFKLI
jgi:hypothetical protein